MSINIFKFYWLCIKEAFIGSWQWTEKASAIALIVLPFAIWIIPKKSLSKEMESVMNTLIWLIPLAIFSLLGLFRLIMAPYSLYHKLITSHLKELEELRDARRNDLYRYIPQAQSEHVFKILYDLHQEGIGRKNESIEQRQRWDEAAIAILKKYFIDTCLNNYLMATCRIIDPPWYIDMGDEHYDKALSYLDDLLRNNAFRVYLKKE